MDKKMTLQAGKYTFVITFTDEGVVQDIFDDNDEVVATQWELYDELGLQKVEDTE